MHLFGLKSLRPMGIRFGGMGFLRIRRREASPASPGSIHYLRHASAVSAAIAKNMSAVMSQPSELVHSKSDTTSFLDTHNHYSFIAVVALMSLFLVITISATGLLLAFCRKKNTVFTAAPKSDADSQFELDDIENSDIEMCRGDKGECYYHLRDDYDEDDDEEEEEEGCNDNDGDDDAGGVGGGGGKKGGKSAKRSRTFPQLQNVLSGGKGNADRKRARGGASNALTPLIGHDKTHRVNGVCCITATMDDSDVMQQQPQQQDQQQQQQQRMTYNQHQGRGGYARVICHNPNHQHFHYQHHRCPYNFPHYHYRQARPCRGGNTAGGAGRAHLTRLYRNQLPYYGGSRLQRSHTIHAIPQTGSESKSLPAADSQVCGVRIKVQNVDKTSFSHDSVKSNSHIVHSTPSTSDIDIFNDADDEDRSQLKASFSNLKLRLEDDHDTVNVEESDPTKVKVIVHRSANPISSSSLCTAEISALDTDSSNKPDISARGDHLASIPESVHITNTGSQISDQRATTVKNGPRPIIQSSHQPTRTEFHSHSRTTTDSSQQIPTAAGSPSSSNVASTIFASSPPISIINKLSAASIEAMPSTPLTNQLTSSSSSSLSATTTITTTTGRSQPAPSSTAAAAPPPPVIIPPPPTASSRRQQTRVTTRHNPSKIRSHPAHSQGTTTHKQKGDTSSEKNAIFRGHQYANRTTDRSVTLSSTEDLENEAPSSTLTNTSGAVPRTSIGTIANIQATEQSHIHVEIDNPGFLGGESTDNLLGDSANCLRDGSRTAEDGGDDVVKGADTKSEYDGEEDDDDQTVALLK